MTNKEHMKPTAIDIDEPRHIVRVRGEVVRLPTKEYEILRRLVRGDGRVFSRAELIKKVWGAQAMVQDVTVDQHVSRLRRKLAAYGCRTLIRTVPNYGYQYAAGLP